MNGLKNEYQIMQLMNGKRISELDIMSKEFILDLFDNDNLNENNLVKSFVDYNDKKYDIVIIINNTVKRVSIKMGVKNSVHVEGISSFIHFLISNGVNRQNVIEYLKYHYADGTTNGSGVNRISSLEYKKNNQRKIDTLNKQLNTKKILLNAIDRFLLKGRNNDNLIDVILYGRPNDFIWIKTKDIKKIILSKKDHYSTSVHFSNLVVQPFDRCLNQNKKYEKKRFCVQLKWYDLFDCIIENMNINYMNKR